MRVIMSYYKYTYTDIRRQDVIVQIESSPRAPMADIFYNIDQHCFYRIHYVFYHLYSHSTDRNSFKIRYS